MAILAFAWACGDISTRRDPPQRPSLGEMLYGVFCDRLGAQSLHEDLSGSSYRQLCHRQDGIFADTVDSNFLPPAQGGVDGNGQPVPAERQLATRTHAIARIEALARRRADLITALDAMLPDVPAPAKDLRNPDPSRSCSPLGEERFRDQLSDFLNRLQANDLYLDGTLPNSTESMGRVFSSWETDGDLKSAMARLEARKGYRPPDVSLGAIQPLVAYPGLRDLNNSALRLISPDASPYDLDPPRDSRGGRLPVPGTAYPELTNLIEIAHHELRTATADPPVSPLVADRDPGLERDVLNRPRSTAEVLQQLLLVEDPQLGGGAPRYIVRRDQRGVASVALVGGAVPPPFVDQDGDKLADIDDLGRFITSNGAPAPSPFPSSAEQTATSRDSFGRATAGGRLIYDYVDTNHTFVAALLEDLKPLVNPNPSDQHESLMDALAGLQPFLGTRRPAMASYRADAREGAAVVAYNRFDPKDSAVLDLAWAAGQMLGDPTIDDTLALTRKLFAEHPDDMARLVGAMLKAKEIADRHAEATLSSRSTFWDELIQVGINIARAPAVAGRPPLLEDLLIALAADDARPFKDVLAMQMSHKDLVSYNRLDINGPPLSYLPGASGGVDVDHPNGTFSMWYTPVDRTQPDTGTNRSFFQRYLQLIHDTNDVTECNANGGRLFLHNICEPTFGCIDLEYPSYPGSTEGTECLLYQIHNLAAFYVDSIVGKAEIYLRPVLGVRQFQSPQMFSDSTGLEGFWPTPHGETLRPKPEFLNRLDFFDFNDSPHQGDLDYRTNCFISALNGPFHGTELPIADADHQCIEQPPDPFPAPGFLGSAGTTLCRERELHDPCATSLACHCPGPDPGCTPDNTIRKLRDCDDGQWLAQRDNNVLFAFEQPLQFPDGTRSSTFRALTPVVTVFATHSEENLFLSLIEVLYRHWQDDRGTTDECPRDLRPTDLHYCSQDGLVRSEPMLAEIFGQTDLMDALNNLNKILINTTIQHCDAVDPITRRCTSSRPMDGITVMANAVRALIDPDRNVGLTDRRGIQSTTWNDGETLVPQVTPLYLLTNALRSVDNLLDPVVVADRKAQWLRARSQLVDQFLGVIGSGSEARFSRPGLPRVAITAVDSIRAQLLAKCPGTFNPPYADRCRWARDEIFSNLKDTLSGPLFAATQDLTEAIRQDTSARLETEKLLTHLVSPPVNDPMRAALLASLADIVQIASDQANFIPILHALSPAVSLSAVDLSGSQLTGMVDAQLSLLTRASGKAFNADNGEVCANEVDPNQVITAVLRRASVPVSINGSVPQTPLEVFLDVIADVNRAAPEQTGKLRPSDYASIFHEVSDFMLNPEHGLEQFYEVVRQGTLR
ncbi:MAG TPA: hypothetical protein VEM39_10855 [Myxococcaceae bacterium]|nr:hypothetical protein [Myxococcaceae bacterium]